MQPVTKPTKLFTASCLTLVLYSKLKRRVYAINLIYVRIAQKGLAKRTAE